MAYTARLAWDKCHCSRNEKRTIHPRAHAHTNIPIFFKAINDTNEVHTTIDGDADDEDEGSRKEWPDWWETYISMWVSTTLRTCNL